MSTNLYQLHPAAPEPRLRAVGQAVDYCECGRGPVIGRVSYGADQMRFFPVGTLKGDDHEDAADLRCIDCVAETATKVAVGEAKGELRSLAMEVREKQIALLRRSQVSVANPSRQDPPTEGAGMT